jgi:hypothetical protein
MANGTESIRCVENEQLFDINYSIHIAIGHGGCDLRMISVVFSNFAPRQKKKKLVTL